MLSFQRWDLQSQEHPFVGLQNYRDVLLDPRVWGALQNTGIIVVCAVAVEFLLGLGLALLFVGDFTGKRFAMPLLMLPVMVVPIVVGLTWRMLWDNQYGAINQTLSWIAGRDVNILWLAHRDTALFAMIVTDVWQWTPFMFLVLLAALSSVNPELYEAASLDGAGWWQALRDVSLPGIARVIAVAILFRALDAFKVFDLVYMFTQGGPGTSTETISWYIYQLGFKFFRLGYASAVSFVVVIFLTIVATLYVAPLRARGRRVSAVERPCWDAGGAAAHSAASASRRDPWRGGAHGRCATPCCSSCLIFCLFPILWVIGTSVKLPGEYLRNPPVWIPQNPTLVHFSNVMAADGESRAEEQRDHRQRRDVALDAASAAWPPTAWPASTPAAGISPSGCCRSG